MQSDGQSHQFKSQAVYVIYFQDSVGFERIKKNHPTYTGSNFKIAGNRREISIEKFKLLILYKVF